MEHHSQVEHVEQLFAYLDAGGTAMAEAIYENAISTYTCDEQLSVEQDVLFRRSPIVHCLTAEMPNPGDYVTDDFSGVPLLVVRGQDGVVRGFLNVCRHRGARVIDGRGNRRRFSCPYHAWTYDGEGKLCGIPNDDGFDTLDRASHGLRPVPVIEKYGFIWIIPSAGNQSIDVPAMLGGLSDELSNYHLENFHHYETRVLRKAMNWKLVVDTFLETYHLRMLHRKTIHPILHSNLATFGGYGRNLRLVAARRSFEEMRDQPKAEWDLIKHSAIVYILFPNTVVIVQGDHLETFRVFPDENSTDHAKMYISLYTPEPADTDRAARHWDRNMTLLLDTVEREDFEVGQKAQVGFYSGAQDHIIFGRNEPALAHYHTAIREAITPAA